jgi:5'-nucleotidase
MRIGCDVDGVLRDFVSQLKEVYKKHNPTHEVGDVTQWNMSNAFPQCEDIKKFYIDYADDVMGNAMPYIGARTFIQDIVDAGHDVIIVTHQHSNTEKYTLDWLNKWGFPYKAIIFAEDKTIADVDIILDDNPRNIKDLRSVNRHAVLFDQPWNKDMDGERVYNYQEFLDKL